MGLGRDSCRDWEEGPRVHQYPGLQESTDGSLLDPPELQAFTLETAQRLARLAACKDCEGSGHVERVGKLSALIAEVMGLPSDRVEAIRVASPLHDIGNLAIPESILLKDDALSLEELDEVKKHTEIGGELLAGSGSSILRIAELIARTHHENWDGTGYHPGVGGESIPLEGRIVRVADTFDSVVHSRPFRGAWRRQEAIDFIKDHAGHRFDPAVVWGFMKVVTTGQLDE